MDARNQAVVKTMEWKNGALVLLDQTKLPGEVEYIICRDHQAVGDAIKKLSVRGAPAIGAAAAYGFVLGVKNAGVDGRDDLLAAANKVFVELAAVRPTAVNLKWALDRMLAAAQALSEKEPEKLLRALENEAHQIYAEDFEANKKIGSYGQELIPDGAAILTHCNAGALATTGYGTALGVVRAAVEAGKKISIYADETRPLLQGARLTAWEMVREGIPVTIITDSMAGYLMSKRKVDAVVVGADRITANGDTANKIGTYSLSVLAKEHGVPFYVAAPLSTIDFNLPRGDHIPIEEREPVEVTCIGGKMVAPPGVRVWNPAFDVTPAVLITAIITDRGVVRPPYVENLARVRGGKHSI